MSALIHAPARPSIEPIFRPRSVALIGASREKHSIGWDILDNLLRYEFQGLVFPVNPKADGRPQPEVLPVGRGDPRPRRSRDHRRCRSSCVVDAGRSVRPQGRRGLVVITAGFKEVGEAGAAMEHECVDIVQRYGMRMIGPNCMGVINTDPAVRLHASFSATTEPLAGNVAFSSQSGALGEAILALMSQLGLGLSMFASLGNKADVSGNDLLELLGARPAHPRHPDVPRELREPAALRADRPARHAQEADPRDEVGADGGRRARRGVAHRLARRRRHRRRVAARAVRRASARARSRRCSCSPRRSPRSRRPRATASPSSPTRAGRASSRPTRWCSSASTSRRFGEATQAKMRPVVAAEASVVNPVDMIASARGGPVRGVHPRGDGGSRHRRRHHDLHVAREHRQHEGRRGHHAGRGRLRQADPRLLHGEGRRRSRRSSA